MTTPVKRSTQVVKRDEPESSDYKATAINVPVRTDHTPAEYASAVAQKLAMPEVNAATVIEKWQPQTHNVNALVAELQQQVQAVNGGDLRRAEGMLIAQAHALDQIFTNLARRATHQTKLLQWETYMRFAMKAQNQCRMTLESLATIKNPPAVFARQANINNGGNQQVNNGPAASAPPAHAEEKPLNKSKLLATPSAALTTGLFSKPQRAKAVRAQPARPGHGKS